MADHKFQVEGKEYDWVGGVSETPYRIVFNGENVVVIVIKEGNDKEIALMLNFVDHDTFWLYSGNADSPFPDVHIREYFRRISN